MDFVVFVVVFAVFIAGLTLAIQGFVGREIYPEERPSPWLPTSIGLASPIPASGTRCACSSSASP